MQSENLKPCPFCGGEADRVDIEDGENAGGSFVHCTVCDASGNIEFEFKENFISNWNRRVEAALSAAEPQPAPSVAVKALQAVRDELRVDTSSGSPGSISYEVGALHRIVAAVDAALSAQVQDVAGWEAIAKAAQDYVDAVSGEPEKDCWDTEDGKEAPGADKFASDWAWKEYDDAKQKAFDNLRAMLAAAPAKQEG